MKTRSPACCFSVMLEILLATHHSIENVVSSTLSSRLSDHKFLPSGSHCRARSLSPCFLRLRFLSVPTNPLFVCLIRAKVMNGIDRSVAFLAYAFFMVSVLTSFLLCCYSCTVSLQSAMIVKQCFASAGSLP